MRGVGLHRSVLPFFDFDFDFVVRGGASRAGLPTPLSHLVELTPRQLHALIFVGDTCKPFFFVSSRQRLSLFFVSSVSAQSGLNNRCRVQILGGLLVYSLCINGSYCLRNRSFEEYSLKANQTSRANTVSLQKG